MQDKKDAFSILISILVMLAKVFPSAHSDLGSKA